MRDITLDAKALELAMEAAENIKNHPERGYSYLVTAIQVAVLDGMKFTSETAPVVVEDIKDLTGVRAYIDVSNSLVIMNGSERTAFPLQSSDPTLERIMVITQFVNRLARDNAGAVLPIQPAFCKVTLEEGGFRFFAGPLSHLIEMDISGDDSWVMKGFLEFLRYNFDGELA